MKQIWITAISLLLAVMLTACHTSPASESTTSSLVPTQSSSVPMGNPTLESGKYEDMGYLLWVPDRPRENMPLIVYLHGGNGKGSDTGLLLVQNGFPRYLIEGRFGSLPAYVLIPQLDSAHPNWNAALPQLAALIDSITTQRKIDAARISLTGHSIGATAVWDLALTHPGKFSAIAPLGGSIDTTQFTLSTLRDTPIWAIVGSADTTGVTECNSTFISALEQQNPVCYLTVVEGAGHSQITDAYLNSQSSIVYWLLSQ